MIGFSNRNVAGNSTKQPEAKTQKVITGTLSCFSLDPDNITVSNAEQKQEIHNRHMESSCDQKSFWCLGPETHIVFWVLFPRVKLESMDSPNSLVVKDDNRLSLVTFDSGNNWTSEADKLLDISWIPFAETHDFPRPWGVPRLGMWARTVNTRPKSVINNAIPLRTVINSVKNIFDRITENMMLNAYPILPIEPKGKKLASWLYKVRQSTKKTTQMAITHGILAFASLGRDLLIRKYVAIQTNPKEKLSAFICMSGGSCFMSCRHDMLVASKTHTMKMMTTPTKRLELPVLGFEPASFDCSVSFGKQTPSSSDSAAVSFSLSSANLCVSLASVVSSSFISQGRRQIWNL